MNKSFQILLLFYTKEIGNFDLKISTFVQKLFKLEEVEQSKLKFIEQLGRFILKYLSSYKKKVLKVKKIMKTQVVWNFNSYILILMNMALKELIFI